MILKAIIRKKYQDNRQRRRLREIAVFDESHDGHRYQIPIPRYDKYHCADGCHAADEAVKTCIKSWRYQRQQTLLNVIKLPAPKSVEASSMDVSICSSAATEIAILQTVTGMKNEE